MTDIRQGYINFVDVPHECRHCHVKQIHSVPTACVIDTEIVAVEFPLCCHQCGLVKHYSVLTKKP